MMPFAIQTIRSPLRGVEMLESTAWIAAGFAFGFLMQCTGFLVGAPLRFCETFILGKR